MNFQYGGYLIEAVSAAEAAELLSETVGYHLTAEDVRPYP